MSNETNKKVLVSAIFATLMSVFWFYVGNRYGLVIEDSGQPFGEVMNDAFVWLIPAIAANPFTVSWSGLPLLIGGILFVAVWLIWLRFAVFIGNYRVGEESGSARWGTIKEGQAFLDKKNKDNNLLFTENFGMAIKRKKFNLKLDRNLNVMVIGGTGSGKTRYYVKPNLMQLNTSFFVTDPKGTLLEETGKMFQDAGYRVKVFNTVQFDKSLHYNPLHYVKTDADIHSFINCLIKNTSGDGSKGDPFWENAERLLYTALIALLRDYFPKKDYSLDGVLRLLDLAEAKDNDENFESALDLMFKQIETGKKYKRVGSGGKDAATAEAERGFAETSEWAYVPSSFKRHSDGVRPADCGGLKPSDDFALKNYKAFRVAAGKTLKSIIVSCNARLGKIATGEIRELLRYDEMELDTLGDEYVVTEDSTNKYTIHKDKKQNKAIVYAILSDTDKTFSFLFAILMWQSIDILCRKALMAYGGRLPQTVHFIFDEFANIGTLESFAETIAVTRSRNIAVTCILQSVNQLESRYDKDAKTIIDCCDTTLFLGGKSTSTNEEIAKMIGKQTINQLTFGESMGQSSSASKNMQIQGRDLIDAAEIGKMPRDKAILLISGTNPFMDTKYPIENHPRYGLIDKEPFDFDVWRKEQKG